MIHGHIESIDAYRHLLANPAWNQSFDWLRRLPAAPEPGRQVIEGEDLFAIVQGYRTLSREDCRYESHRKYVDLQYCLDGGELIDCEEASSLSVAGSYDESSDLQFYQPGDSLTTLQMARGNFAIFFPSDAHQPKRGDGRHPSVFKVVIKIARGFLES